jgi:branched-chain amino acid transport system substrate-binding protein
LDSKAITKIQTMMLIAIIVIAAVAGAAAYYLWTSNAGTSNTIKIGILTDLEVVGDWHAAVLAAEQINAEGGILGKQVEIIGEDIDIPTQDTVTYTNALIRLLTYHKVDFVVAYTPDEMGFIVQDKCAEQNKIVFATGGGADELTQRVIDDYDKAKYYFRMGWNQTSISQGATDGFLTLSMNSDLNKVALLSIDLPDARFQSDALAQTLVETYGYEIVYKDAFPPGTADFTSYFAKAEAAGAEILVPWDPFQEGIAIAKEWYDRQSPMIIYSGVLFAVADTEGWNLTEGKCEYISVSSLPIVADYPFTSKTIPTREAFQERWGEPIVVRAAMVYDVVRFILPDAIEKAGTTETEAVIKALETTSIGTSQAPNFVFTSNHDVMMGKNPNDPDANYMIVMVFQWQNGELVPVHPQKVMEAAGAAFKFPPWDEPWNK